jgi:peptidoglycan/xylan/chitin deacetylase (PgdA/CDA1 family)
MKPRIRMRSLAAIVVGAAVALACTGPDEDRAPPNEPPRAVAVTFDDIPGPSPGLIANDVPTLRETTRKLLATLKEHGVPTVAFVTTGILHVDGQTPGDLRARRDVVRMWRDAGHELGNHSHSHRSLNRIPLADFQDDVVRAERELEAILGKGRKPRYFRYPMLHVGTELEKRRAFEAWLSDRGYEVAVVTMDNDDYIYAAAYAAALRRGDRDFALLLGEDYVRYMEEIFRFWEAVAQDVFGRPIPHVLLLHANALNADYFGRLAGMMERRGYRFVSLGEAQQDEAYGSPDTWVGRWGLSWLHHWALTAGRPRAPDPDPPTWVMEAYEARNRPVTITSGAPPRPSPRPPETSD